MSDRDTGYFITRLARWLIVALLCVSVSTRAGRLNIVTTTSDLASIASAVAGDAATITSIATGVQDPHFLQAKPSYIMKARHADLWIRVGMELEIGWEQPIINGARNPDIRVGTPGHLDTSSNVIRLQVPSQRVTREMGDVHPSGNPHYWLDPLNGRIMAQDICERLCKLMPDQASVFRDNLRAFVGDLDTRMFGPVLVEKLGGDRAWALLLNGQLDRQLTEAGSVGSAGGWYGAMRPHRGKGIATYHRSWNYLTSRFGLSIAAELEPKPGIPPSATHLAGVVKEVKNGGVKVILIEPFYNRKSADFVASRTGATAVVAANSVGGSPEASDYLSLIDLIVTRLSKAL